MKDTNGQRRNERIDCFFLEFMKKPSETGNMNELSDFNLVGTKEEVQTKEQYHHSVYIGFHIFDARHE